MSCGPGWLVAHAPSVIVGYPATMAALFTCAVVVVHLVHGFDTAANFVVLLAITPGFWLSYANGNDFVTFGVIVVAVSALTTTNRRMQRWLAAVGAIALSQFRLPFVLLPAAIPLDPPRLREHGRHPRLLAAVACLLSIGLYGVFVWWRPDLMLSDGPFHVLEKSMNLVGFPGGRITVIVVFVILTGVIATIARRFHPRYSALAYIALTLIPLSIASLITTIRTHHGVVDVLGHWEGVSWLTAVVAVAAGLVGSVDRSERMPTEASASAPSAPIPQPDLASLDYAPDIDPSRCSYMPATGRDDCPDVAGIRQTCRPDVSDLERVTATLPGAGRSCDQAR